MLAAGIAGWILLNMNPHRELYLIPGIGFWNSTLKKSYQQSDSLPRDREYPHSGRDCRIYPAGWSYHLAAPVDQAKKASCLAQPAHRQGIHHHQDYYSLPDTMSLPAGVAADTLAVYPVTSTVLQKRTRLVSSPVLP